MFTLLHRFCSKSFLTQYFKMKQMLLRNGPTRWRDGTNWTGRINTFQRWAIKFHWAC